MRILYGILLAFVVITLSGFAFIYSGIYDVTARDEHSALSKWVLHTTMEKSVQARVSDLDVPANLASKEMIRKGARAYDQLCAACHLKPGQDNTLLRQGLNPTPPSLTEAGHFGPAEQFWVIKNGIKMTGMPAWGSTHADKDLWELTAFIRRLPSLSEDQYNRLVQSDSGLQAKADDGHAHDHGNMNGMMAKKSSHGEPGHHSDAESKDAGQAEAPSHHEDADETSGHHDEAEASGHHDEEAQKAKGESKADDHYSDGHSH